MDELEPEGAIRRLNAPVFDYRASRGKEIASVESNIRRVDQNEYRVKSQSGKGEYVVISTESGWSCSCPDFAFRGVKCKHAFAVELSLQIRRRIENARRLVPLDYQSCLMCGAESGAIVKDGLIHHKSGDIQRFLCHVCGKRFSKNIGFERMRASPETITLAMQIYFGGASLRNTQKALRLQGVNVSHVAILKWIRKYVALMDEYMKRFTPRVGDTWRADEMYVKFKGNMKYLFSMMDDETRFWIAQDVCDSKEKVDAKNLFLSSQEVADKIPKTLITDGLKSYHEAFKRTYAKPHWREQDMPRHIREIALAGQIHNNKMERMNGEVRDRERVMRGLKNPDTAIVKGLQIYHNYVRPHEALKGDTPADRAGIKVEGQNKWLTLIQNAGHLQAVNREKLKDRGVSS